MNRHMFAGVVPGLLLGLAVTGQAQTAIPSSSHPPIAVRFTLKEPGFVTLVVEDKSGKRIRNLIGDTRFPAGSNVVWWDGTDESLGMRQEPDGVYRAQGKLVQPGSYRVRGLFHKGIDLRYEFTVNNAGSPAWRNPEGTGGWLADHTPPSAVLYQPGRTDTNPGMMISAFVGEAGDALIWTDMNGRKQRGLRWVGGTWTGATHLARDDGSNAVPGVDAYAVSSWWAQGQDGIAEVRFTAIADGQARSPLLAYPLPGKRDTTKLGDGIEKRMVSGFAAYNGILAASLFREKKLLFVDARSKKPLGEAPLDDPRGLAFDTRGRLLALVGTELRRYDMSAIQASGYTRLPAPEVLISTGLENSNQLTLDAAGNIYISDRGRSQQVKVFDAAGKLLRTVGTPGGAQLGPYDETRMHNPAGMAVTPEGQLWVAEEDFAPKRVSVWSPTGQFVKAFYGPPQYGAGGNLSADKARFYYHDHAGMQFNLDWAKGTWKLANIYDMPSPDLLLPKTFRPQNPLTFQGREYLTNLFNSGATDTPAIAGLWLMRDGRAVLVAAAGDASDWPLLHQERFKSRLPNDDLGKYIPGRSPILFAWSDANGDGQVQPEEVTSQKTAALPGDIEPGGGTFRVGRVTLAPDLTVVTTFSYALKPQGFTAAGVPLYDAAHAERQIQEPIGVQTFANGHDVIAASDGHLIVDGDPIRGFKNGQLEWTYPNGWPSLHTGHNAPPQQYPGQLIATTKPVGFPIVPPGSDAGPMWVYNADPGHMYLLTTDGLFVSQFFVSAHKVKVPGWDSVPDVRGTRLNDIQTPGENFMPTVNQTADGEVYLVTGKEHSSIVHVEGLSAVRRLPATELTVTAAELAQAGEYFAQRDAQRQATEGPKTLILASRTTAPSVDGKLDDWTGADWAQLDQTTQAAVAISGDRLYAAFRTQDRNLLTNTGESLPLLFKTGGALDLMLGTNPQADPRRNAPVEGDLRLLVTLMKGKPVAALYRPVAKEKNPVPFASPWRTISFDRVDDVSGEVKLASAKRAENLTVKGKTTRLNWEEYEFSIPLSILGLKPQIGTTIQGDIGILREGGGETVQRLYWSNKATGLVNDVPGEAMLTPKLWGNFRIDNGG